MQYSILTKLWWSFKKQGKLSDVNNKSRENFIHSICPEIILTKFGVTHNGDWIHRFVLFEKIYVHMHCTYVAVVTSNI